MAMNQKHVFWQALLVAIFVFVVGIFLGYLIEQNRTSDILTTYQQLEIDMLDVKVQSEVYSLGDLNCKAAVEENMAFADRVYDEAKVLDRFGDASRFTDGILLQHKKYDLLRVLLWINSMKIKERCGSDFNIVVYVYDYDEPELEVNSRQKVFSNILGELKNRQGSKVILIPMAGDLGINSIEFMKKEYGITELPTILINEKIKITEVESVDEIEKLLE